MFQACRCFYFGAQSSRANLDLLTSGQSWAFFMWRLGFIYIYIIYIYLLFECIRHIFTSTLSQLYIYIYIYLFIQFKCTCKRVISIHCMLKSASNIHPWDVGVFKLGSCTPKIAFLCVEKDTEACDFGVYLNFRDLNIYIWSAPNLDSPKSIQFHQTRCIHTESCC